MTNIDKIAPTGTVSYSTTAWTNQDVTMTLATNEDIATPDGWTKVDDKHYTKIVSANETGIVTIQDLAGNTADVNYSVTNIDKVVPNCGNWTYNPTTPTSGDVVATLSNSTDNTGGSGIATV